MTTHLTRRGILKALGIGTLALAAEPILEPARKLWFVSSNAPVGSRIETGGLDRYIARTWSMKLQLSEEALEDARSPQMIANAREVKRAMHAEMERDFEALHRDLYRKIRSQEDLDTVRIAARLAEVHPMRDRLLADMGVPRTTRSLDADYFDQTIATVVLS